MVLSVSILNLLLFQFFERLQLFEEESRARKQELNERTLREIKESLEKKLAGQHKLSKREEQMYDALKGRTCVLSEQMFMTGC